MLVTIDSIQIWSKLMEKVNIKIDLSIVTHELVKEPPFVNISLNGHPQFGQLLNEDTLVEIDVEIEDDTNNFLTIEYQNKDPKHDVVIGHDGEVVRDKRVEITNIFIEDVPIDFHSLVDPSVIKYETNDTSGQDSVGFSATKLAWNGKTTLQFTTPVYIWLLENL